MTEESTSENLYSSLPGGKAIPAILNSIKASLFDFLAILNILIEDDIKIQNKEDKQVWANVCEGIELLIKLKFEYDNEKDFNEHFQHRLRGPDFRGKRGPKLISGKNFRQTRTNLQKSIIPGSVSLHVEHMQQLKRLVKLLNTKLLFRSYNRSVRFLDLMFTILLLEGKKIRESTADWIRDDLFMLSDNDDATYFSLGSFSVTYSEISDNLKGTSSSADFFLHLYELVSTDTEKYFLHHLRKLDGMKKIRPHPEGAKVSISTFHFISAWLYILLVIVASVTVAVVNVANRENWYERVMDFVQTATLLLVSVFGLLKLTSEDQGVIRHTCRGYKVLRTAKDVMKAWGLDNEQDLKIAIAVSDERHEWLDGDGACYAVRGAGKGIRLSPGIETRILYRLFGGFDGNRYFHRNDQKGYHIRFMESGTIHILTGAQPDLKYLYPDLKDVVKAGLAT